MQNLTDLPSLLRAEREAQGLTLDDVAARISEQSDFSITGAAIGHFELGRRQVRLRVLEPWAAVLGVSITADTDAKPAA